MIRLSALNDSSDDDESHSVSKVRASTKEAQESEALALYNQALSLLRQGDEDGARNTFLQLLEVKLVKEAAPLTSEDEGLVHPGMVLKYSTYKNLASMAAQHEKYDTAMQFYLEAVMVDSSDVTVWYKIGSIALKIEKYQLARHAFEQGLECQPRHWPCLDNVITVLYALNNYEACLVYISRAMARDPGYIKGISFMEKIFDEQPSLRRDMLDYFTNCDPTILTAEVDQEEADEYISEALDMRNKKLLLGRRPAPPVLTLRKPLEAYTWEKLGSSLIALYDYISTASRPVSFACRVDISMYTSIDDIKLQAPPGDPVVTPTLEPPGGSTLEEQNQVAPIVQMSQFDTALNTTATTTLHEQSLNQSQGMENASVEKEPAKRGPKKKKQLSDETTKRRSARVRNTGKKPAEDQINLQDLIMTFLPSTLIQVQDDGEGTESSQEELMDTSVTDSQQREAQGPTDSNDPNTSDEVFVTASEQDDVLNFMKSHQANSGVIDLLNEFLICLANKCNVKWPAEVANMYVIVYSRLRNHIVYPGYLCKDVPDVRLRNMGLMCLVQGELKVDKWLSMKTKVTPGPSPRRSGQGAAGLGANFPGTFFKEDLLYLVGLSQCQDVLDDLWLEFIIRVSWVRARFLMLDGNMEDAVTSFDETTMYLTIAEKEAGGSASIKLPHCRHDNHVTLVMVTVGRIEKAYYKIVHYLNMCGLSTEDVTRQLDSLHRCQSQDKMQDLHDCGQYEKVILLLLETFIQNPEKSKVLEIETQERHAQLLLLMDSLLKIKDFKRGLIWGEVSLNEAIHKYNNAPTSSVREEWASTMSQLLDKLNKCVSRDEVIVKYLTSRNVVRLTQNLMSIMELAQDVPDSAADMAIPSVTPWILLYKLIQWEEKKGTQQLEDEDEEELALNMPATLTLLTVAHDQLGRRSWCTNSDGSLLLFTVKEVQAELEKAVVTERNHPLRADLENTLEQCFYCLYGHPHRRKAKHLQDHNCKQVALTWERAIPVFQYFKPKSVPEYDSYKTSTVSGEQESLLRRISALVPQRLKPPLAVEQVMAYIEGTTNQPPTTPEGATSKLPVVKELYYLLADYYFKNKEQAKAIKFYLQDLCVCPSRFDSWAGMALARASRLEQKLSTFELKSEGKAEGSIWKHAIASLRCFQRALDLDSSNSKLWIEYGALAYQLHTLASRQLKQLKGENLLRKQTLYPLSEESLKEARSNRTEMLRIAGNCYKKASECEAEDHEEEWLHHYMLGKVSEKMGRSPAEYLQHYKQALHFLHEDRARYPRRITYIYSPPHLAVETLEVYYRMHVSILKYLLRNPDKSPYELFEKYLQEVAEGPFVNCLEKDKKAKERDSSMSVDENSSSNVFSPISTCAPVSLTGTTSTKGKRPCHVTRMDHTYSKQRSLDSSGRSDPESSNEAGREGGKEALTAPKTAALLQSVSPVGTTAAVTSVQSSQPTATTAIPKTANSTVTSFSMATILGDMITKELVGSSKEADASSTSANTARAVDDKPESSSVAADSKVEPGVKSIIPDTTQAEGPPPAMSPQIVVDSSTAGGDPEELLSSSSKLSSPQVVSSQSQDSQSICNTSTIETEPADGDLDSNQSQSQLNTSQTSSIDVQCYTERNSDTETNTRVKVEEKEDKKEETVSKLYPVETEEAEDGEPSRSADSRDQYTGSFDQTDIKEEIEEKCEFEGEKESPEEVKDPMDIKEEIECNVTSQVTDSSSQDSTTAAELEKLKSEILFLNAGCTDMTGDIYTGSFDQMDMKEEIKEECEGEKESQEEVKDEDVRSRDEALENLKSELQELSAAAGMQQPAYLITAPTSTTEDTTKTGKPAWPGDDDKTATTGAGVETSCGTAGDGIQTAKDKVGETSDVKPSAPPNSTQPEPIQGPGDAPPKDSQTTLLAEAELVTSKVSELQEDKGLSPEKDAGENGSGQEERNSEKTPSKPAEVEAPSTSDLKGQQNTGSDEKSVRQEPTEVNKEEENKEGKKEENVLNPDSKERVSDTQEDPDLKSTEDVKELHPSGDTSKKEENSASKTKLSSECDSAAQTDTVGDKARQTQETQQTPKDQGEEEKVGVKNAQDESSSAGPVVVPTQEERSKKVITQCMTALSLCIARFPHHYKSLYWLAYIYYHCKEFKDLTKARDMLLGHANWQQLEHMSSPGLFQDRKTTNFFQGLWRIPIEEIDRSGSFGCHMLRSLQLLFAILKDMRDAMTYFSIHSMLARTPDQGKKYLRDSDRVELSRLALVSCINSLDELVKVKATEKRREIRVTFMMEVYRVWLYAIKLQDYSRDVNRLLRKAFATCLKEEVQEEPSVLEQTIRFCQKQQALRPPMPPEGSRTSASSTPTSNRSQPLDLTGSKVSGRLISIGGDTPQTQSSKATTSDSPSEPLKGITPLPSSQVRPSPMAKIADTIKTFKPGTGHLPGPSQSKSTPTTLNAPARKTTSSLPTSSKTDSEQAGKKPEGAISLKRKFSSSDGASPSLSSSGQSQAKKSASKVSSSAGGQSGYSMFQPSATSSPGRGGAMGLPWEMSESLLMQAGVLPHLAGFQREALKSQMALASQLGMPLAGLPYMYPGAAMDPIMWSALASNVAAQVLKEPVRSVGSSPGRKPAKAASSTTSSSSSSQSRPSSSSARQPTHKASPSATNIPKHVSSSEPPAKIQRMTPPTKTSPATATQKVTKTAPAPKTYQSPPMQKFPATEKPALSSTSTAATSKSTTGSSLGSKAAGAKLLAKASELYAVRMSSALARRTNQPGSHGVPEGLSLRAPGAMGAAPSRLSTPGGAKVTEKTAVNPQRVSPTSLSQSFKRGVQGTAAARMVHRTNPQVSQSGQHSQRVGSQPTPPPAHSNSGSASQRGTQPGVPRLAMMSKQPPPLPSSFSSTKSQTPSLQAIRFQTKGPFQGGTRPVIRPVPPLSQGHARSQGDPSRQPTVGPLGQPSVPSQSTGSVTKSVQPLPGGYGRGKPSYPATLPATQSSSDSEDCIIISSSQDSDSD